MIKLKTEVNKSAVMRELQAKAIEGFKDSWQPELQVQAYMNGVHDLFKLLRLGDVVKPKGTFCQTPDKCQMSYYHQIGDYYCSKCEKTGLA